MKRLKHLRQATENFRHTHFPFLSSVCTMRAPLTGTP
jgi:hypothetical protein